MSKLETDSNLGRGIGDRGGRGKAKKGRARYLARTGYSSEQWAGREALVVRMPEKPTEADLLAAVKNQFPDLDEDTQEAICIMVGDAETKTFFAGIQKLARHTRWLARQRNHKLILSSDVEDAIEDVFGKGAIPAQETAPTAGMEQPKKTACRAPARAVQPGRIRGVARPEIDAGVNRFDRQEAALQVVCVSQKSSLS